MSDLYGVDYGDRHGVHQVPTLAAATAEARIYAHQGAVAVHARWVPVTQAAAEPSEIIAFKAMVARLRQSREDALRQLAIVTAERDAARRSRRRFPLPRPRPATR